VDAGPEVPFGTIEGALEYVALLAEAIEEAEASVQEDIAKARAQNESRQAEALQLVAFKLEKLRAHLTSSRRILNDLRTLRRLLLSERGTSAELEEPQEPDPFE
jgi:hypothetical protein